MILTTIMFRWKRLFEKPEQSRSNDDYPCNRTFKPSKNVYISDRTPTYKSADGRLSLTVRSATDVGNIDAVFDVGEEELLYV